MTDFNTKGTETGRWRSDVLKVTGATTEHFFVVDPIERVMMRDPMGRVLVYTSREAAMAAGELWRPDLCGVVGMGAAKWALFQREVEHVLVGEQS